MSKSNESSTSGTYSSSSSDEASDSQPHPPNNNIHKDNNSATSDSDTSSEEFFDAEEPKGTLLRYTRKVLDDPKNRVDLTTLTPAQVDSSSSSEVFFSTPPVGSTSSILNYSSSYSASSILSKSEMEDEAEEERRRKRLEEMRRRLDTDEIEEPQQDEQTSPSDSQTSSVEGLYGATCGKTSHPFKVVDHDTVSMQSGVSVGRMGRCNILVNPSINNTFPSAMNSNLYQFQQQQQQTQSSHGTPSHSAAPPASVPIPYSISMNLPPTSISGISKPPFQSSSSYQSPFMTNHHHHHLHHNNNRGVINSSSTTTSSSSSVSSSEQVPSASSAATTIQADFSTERLGHESSPPSETSSIDCSSSIFGKCSSVTAPEPDLVVSCTLASSTNTINRLVSGGSLDTKSSFLMGAPIAPPRRKKRGLQGKTLSEDGGCGSLRDLQSQTPPKDITQQQQAISAQNLPQRPVLGRFESTSSIGTTSGLPSPNPPSPTVSIRSVCRELDKTLVDSNSQNKIFVVKAQDEEKTRAKSSGPKVLRRTESLPKDVIGGFDPSGTGSGGFRDSSSGSSTLTYTETTSINPTGGDESMIQSSSIQTGTGPFSPQTAGVVGEQRSGNNSKSNSAPKSSSSQLASLISAMAMEGDRRESDFSEMLMMDKEMAQFNLIVRTRTDSGKLLSDLEILEQVQVLNLDTGEKVPLSIAEDKIPQCINPLSLHIMRLTSEYVGADRVAKERDSDEESLDSKKSSAASQEDGDSSSVRVRKKTAQVKRFLGSTVRKTVDKAKSLTQRKHPKEDVDISTNAGVQLGSGQDSLVKMKASHSHKGPYDFDQLQQVQDLFGEHCGPVWCMKFSNCGRLLATAGQDKIIRIWVLKDHLPYFQDMRTKNTSDKVSPTPSQESIVSQHSHHSAEEMLQACENSDPRSPFVPRPLCVYSGHTADLLDIAWSKSFFLLSSSMDRTVRLWHISRRECLCCFQHIDFVTAIAFHPRDDRYFLSGSLDGKLRLWNIPDKKVALWNEVNGPNNLITAANFCQNGKFAVVGTYDGRCIFYHTEQLKYHTQIIVHKRKRLAGRKITGIEPMPGEDKILVTSNDSRIRLYDLRDLSLTCKYKGFTNSSSQIKGTFSHDGKYIVSGSENQCVYIWKTNHDYSKFSSARRDRNGYWEGVKAHNAVVTCAVLAPDPDLIVKQIDKLGEQEADRKQQQRAGMVKSPSLTKSNNLPHHQQSHASTCPAGYVLVSADFSGCIKVFYSKVKPKHSSLPASALV